MGYSISMPPNTSGQLLGTLSAANLNSTADQAVTLLAGNKQITKILLVGASGSTTTAVGGFYTGASKTGTTVVANTQVYTALSATQSLSVTLAADYLTGTSLFFALTTGQGTACTATIYVYGNVLS